MRKYNIGNKLVHHPCHTGPLRTSYHYKRSLHQWQRGRVVYSDHILTVILPWNPIICLLYRSINTIFMQFLRHLPVFLHHLSHSKCGISCPSARLHSSDILSCSKIFCTRSNNILYLPFFSQALQDRQWNSGWSHRLCIPFSATSTSSLLISGVKPSFGTPSPKTVLRFSSFSCLP